MASSIFVPPIFASSSPIHFLARACCAEVTGTTRRWQCSLRVPKRFRLNWSSGVSCAVICNNAARALAMRSPPIEPLQSTNSCTVTARVCVVVVESICGVKQASTTDSSGSSASRETTARPLAGRSSSTRIRSRSSHAWLASVNTATPSCTCIANECEGLPMRAPASAPSIFTSTLNGYCALWLAYGALCGSKPPSCTASPKRGAMVVGSITRKLPCVTCSTCA